MKHYTELSQYGLSDVLDVTVGISNEARAFIVSLYVTDTLEDLNVLREHIFASSQTDLRNLPPTEDSFHQHLLRALYQLIIYKRAHMCKLSLPPVTQYGRRVVNGILQPIMMTKPAKPTSAKSASCKCKLSKCLRNCLCAKAQVPCYIGCSCLGKADKCLRVEAHESSEDEGSLI